MLIAAYQGFICHLSHYNQCSTLSRSTLFKIRLKGRIAKACVLFHYCHIAFVATLDLASIPYIGKVVSSLVANRSAVRVPKNLVIYRKTFCWSVQSDRSVAFLDSQSSLVFNLLGRHSIVTCSDEIADNSKSTLSFSKFVDCRYHPFSTLFFTKTWIVKFGKFFVKS